MRSRPAPSLASACARCAASAARRSTSHCARSTASGVRSSCAASAVKRRSRASVVSMRANRPFIARSSGCSSAGVSASGTGCRSSAPRRCRSAVSVRTGASAWRTAQAIASSSTGSTSSQGSSWLPTRSRTSSSRSCMRWPAATSDAAVGGLQVVDAPGRARELQVDEAHGVGAVRQRLAFAVDQQRAALARPRRRWPGRAGRPRPRSAGAGGSRCTAAGDRSPPAWPAPGAPGG